MIVAIVNTKGGVGKTTIAVHAAVWLRERGCRVVAVDADEQRSLTEWLATAAPEIPVEHFTTVGDLLAHLPMLRDEFDAVVVDSPAAMGTEVAAVLSLADVALLPILPSVLDLRASFRTARLIYGVRFHPKRNGLPEAYTVLNRAQSRTRLTRVAAVAIQRYGFPVAPVALEARLAYAEACEAGTVVWRIGRKGQSAAEEMTALLAAVLHGAPRADVIAERSAPAEGLAAPAVADAAAVPVGKQQLV